MNQTYINTANSHPLNVRLHGWHMAHAGTWYYAYTIDGDTVTIQDACHQQNMHEDDKYN